MKNSALFAMFAFVVLTGCMSSTQIQGDSGVNDQIVELRSIPVPMVCTPDAWLLSDCGAMGMGPTGYRCLPDGSGFDPHCRIVTRTTLRYPPDNTFTSVTDLDTPWYLDPDIYLMLAYCIAIVLMGIFGSWLVLRFDTCRRLWNYFFAPPSIAISDESTELRRENEMLRERLNQIERDYPGLLSNIYRRKGTTIQS